MQWQRIRAFFHRDGWLLAALTLVVGLCLALGGIESTPAGQSVEEARLARVLSAIEGAGHVEAAIFYNGAGAAQGEPAMPSGAVVVADGAEDVAVRLRLTRAVCTLLGLDDNQVEVFKGKGGDP